PVAFASFTTCFLKSIEYFLLVIDVFPLCHYKCNQNTPLVSNFSRGLKRDGLIKKYDSLDFIGSYRNKSEDNYTVFALAYKGKQIFRLDAKYLNHPTDGKSIWFHYHIAPNMSTHNDLGKVSIPSFPGWPF
ncbi:hypothetical protein P4S93_11680, partial [Aneurinibacillus thermoaerophilus]|nr:hypothetical protein [Aneurinibacillus thermoaerophilus]